MAAENFPGRAAAAGGDRPASMRPRRMAAENALVHFPGRGPGRGFNEAAAHGRGKRPAAPPAAPPGGRLQ